MAVVEITRRLALENCREGRHKRGPTSGGVEYAGSYEGGSQRCDVCGATRSVSGGKSYEYPYWNTSYGKWRGGVVA